MAFSRTFDNALQQMDIKEKLRGPGGWCAVAKDRERLLELTSPKPPPRPRPPRTNPPNAPTATPRRRHHRPRLPEQLPYQPTDLDVAPAC
jgi:hypothetical protein